MSAVFVTGMPPNNLVLLMFPKLLVFTSVLCNVTMEILEGFLEPIRFFTQEVNKPPRWVGSLFIHMSLNFTAPTLWNYSNFISFHPITIRISQISCFHKISDNVDTSSIHKSKSQLRSQIGYPICDWSQIEISHLWLITDRNISICDSSQIEW